MDKLFHVSNDDTEGRIVRGSVRGHVFRGYMFVSVLKDGKKGLEGSEKCATGWLYGSVENRNEWYCRSFFFFFFFVCKKSITRYFDANTWIPFKILY